MQKRVVGCLAAGAALGAARFADLALWTDRDTGLVTAGWVGWRYLALFAFVAAVLLVSWRGSWQAGPVVRPGGRVPAGALDVSAALAALCMLEQAVGSFVQAEGGASLVRGALAVVCALWLAALDWYWLTNRRESPAAPPPWMAWRPSSAPTAAPPCSARRAAPRSAATTPTISTAVSWRAASTST